MKSMKLSWLEDLQEYPKSDNLLKTFSTEKTLTLESILMKQSPMVPQSKEESSVESLKKSMI